ncbi:MAG: cytochrome c biogenesis protein CcsA [Thermoguttaceae bacterium]|nr:cytochrome c biogenesis protein CcsA [Thermoguttaceae bacterium]MDW8036499.1 cytochrome c biogenesis protein CcsA [Thermoguttaceae bacterium]
MDAGKVSVSSWPWWLRALRTGYQWAASLQVAVVLITLTTGVLGWATFVEKWYGTEAASFGIYRAWWFMVLVGLLGLNVFCATLIRWPWKKHQTGFVITHTGILVLLAGCLLQQGWGIHGQMILHEGEASNVVYEDQKVFRLEIFEAQAGGGRPSEGHSNDGQLVPRTVEVPFRSGPFHWADYQRLPFFPWRIVPRDWGRIYDQDGITLEVLDYYADSERLIVPRLVLGLRRLGQAKWEKELLFAEQGELTLTVVPAGGAHGQQRPMGIGDRQNMPWGPPVVFWLASSLAECQAFLATGPEGTVGSLGQVVLWHQGQVYRFSLQDLQKQPEQRLGASDFKVVFVGYQERFRAVELEIRPASAAAASNRVRMLLFAQNPSHNWQAETLGVYGTYWVEPPPVPERLAGIQRLELLRLAALLRLDLLLGPDGKLYYRQWHAPQLVAAGLWPGMAAPKASAPAEAIPPAEHRPQQASPMGEAYPVEHLGPLRVFSGTPLETEVRLLEFRPASRPTILYEPRALEAAPSAGRFRQPRAKVRLTVRDCSSGQQTSHQPEPLEPTANSGEFWIPLGGPRFADEEAVVFCGNRRVAVQLDYRKWQLGIQIYLRDFTRKVEPGSAHDAHYSSLVDVLEGTTPPKIRQEKVLITMNQPLTAKDPASGRMYRFYQSSFVYLGKPGDPEFDQWIEHRSENPNRPERSAQQTEAGGLPVQGPETASPITEDLYRSILSVNYDPGRGFKYAGSLLIVVGITVMYLMRAYIFAPGAWRWISMRVLVGFGVLGGGLLGSASSKAEELDWTYWRRLPVFADGRLMPLDSFARSVVEQICGRANPRLGLAEALPGEDLDRPEYSEAKQLFPDGKARTWPAHELILSWLVESHRWHRVPFLIAEHHQLREELLGLPREDPSGRPIRYVSPWQLQHAERFWQWEAQLRHQRQQAAHSSQKFHPTGLDRKAWQLLEAYTAWQKLIFSVPSLVSPQSLFRIRLAELEDTWQATSQAMEWALEMAEAHQSAPSPVPAPDSPQSATPQQNRTGGPPQIPPPPWQAYREFQKSLESLRDLTGRSPIDRPQMEHQAWCLRQSAQQLADWFDHFYRRLRQSPPPIRPEAWQQMQAHWMALVSRTRDLHRLAWEVQSALFDDSPVGSGHDMLRLVPSLNPFALELARTPEENPQPWLSWQTLMEASLSKTLAEYPAGEIQAVRMAFQQLAQAYLDRQSPDRAKRFAASMRQLADKLAELGQAINQRRATLPVRNLDWAAFQATQYPPPGTTDLEVHYNQLDPFRLAWIGYLVAVVGFALAFGQIRTAMFWLGMAISLVAQIFIIYGFALRYAITGWVPVTNMFETVVFVALMVGLMGWLFTVWPILAPGLRLAWQLTAWPMPAPKLPDAGSQSSGTLQTPEPPQPKISPDATVPRRTASEDNLPLGLAPGMPASLPTSEDAPLISPSTMQWWRWMLSPFRLLLMAGVFYGLTQVHYGEAEGYTVVSLVPRLERGGALTANDLVAWLVGWAFLLGSMWYVPRVILAAVGSFWTLPVVWYRQSMRLALPHLQERKVYAFSGAIMGLLGALLAYYAPPTVLDKSIGPLRPVLRDNFWLTAHVLTITASYGAGALALALGNLSLFHYLFGRYRNPQAGPALASERWADAQEGVDAAIPGGEASSGSVLPLTEASGSPAPEPHRSASEGEEDAGRSAPQVFVSAGQPTAVPSGCFRREPAACATLARYIYRCMQVAVLLLAAGTLLGALWADVAWGRFWGWDAKEVWALISLLLYMVVLHGRYIGWFGNFGMAAFSVIGATSILMAWYGVNYVLDVGLHTYGRGTGGLGVVLAGVAANWLFLAAAAVRYYLQTRTKTEPAPPLP